MSDDKIRSGIWYSLHRWLGLPVWILLLFVCLTGTLATVSQEITWLFDADTRAPNPADQAHVGYGAIVDTVQARWPQADVLFVADDAPYLAVRVIAALPQAPMATIYVNQYSGEVQGITRGSTLDDFLRSLHGWLLMPWDEGTSWGYYLVGLVGLMLLGSLITALVVDKYFWRGFFRRVRTINSRLFWSDLHRLIGVWSIPFIAVISLTGVWYLTQGAIWDSQNLVQPPAPMIERAALPETATGAPEIVGVAQAVAAARTAVPGLDIAWVSLPETAYHHTEVYGTKGAVPVSDFARAVYVNPYSGEVAAVRDLEGLSTLQWIDHLADPLHYGNFAGLWSKLLYFAFGIALCAMIASGMLVWLRRTAKAVRRQRANARSAAAAGAKP